MPELVVQLEGLARDALREITPAATIGELVEQTAEEGGVVTLFFASTDPGYPGWRWTVSVSVLPGLDPSVLEVELLPGEGALLAPDWVPWSERLEEYRAAQAAAGEAEGDAEEGDADEDDPEGDDDLAGEGAESDEADESGEPQDGIEDDSEPGVEERAEEPSAVASDEESAEEPSAAVVPEGDEQQDEPAAEAADGRPEPRLGVLRRRWRRKKKE